MNNLKNKIFIAAGVLWMSASFSSCQEGWLDINSDPNNAVESVMSADLVLPAAQLNTANRVGSSFGFLGNWLGYWAPGANYAPNAEEQSYSITTNFGAGLFDAINDNSYDYQLIENRATADGQPFYQGIAKIMKAHNFTQLVCLYDKVPYTEALKGIEFIRPKYDEGKFIYEESIKEIDAAIALIKGTTIDANPKIEVSDIIFGGDQTKWVKFANTLKLRLLMHQAYRADRQSYIASEIAKIKAEGSGFLGSGQNAGANPRAYRNDAPNAYYANFGFNQTGNQATDFWRANIVAMNYLKKGAVSATITSDPRLGYFYKKTVSKPPTGAAEPFPQLAPTDYRGNQYGLGINNVTYPYQTAAYVSQVGGVATAGTVSGTSSGIIKGLNMDAWILTSTESMFLQAEAITRGFDIGVSKTAENAYKDAVKESFLWLNVGGSASAATTEFNNWYAGAVTNNVATISFADATDKIRLIMYQKYLSQIGIDHLQTWNDLRRATGGAAQTDPDAAVYAAGIPFANASATYPYLDLSQNPGRSSAIIPIRLLFPQREYNYNTENVPASGVNFQFTGKIWWMP